MVNKWSLGGVGGGIDAIIAQVVDRGGSRRSLAVGTVTKLWTSGPQDGFSRIVIEIQTWSKIVKHLYNKCPTIIKQWLQKGHKLAQKWSNTGPTMIRKWSKNCQTMVNNWFNKLSQNGQQIAKQWSNKLSQNGPTIFNKWPTTGQQMVKQLSNNAIV